MTALANPNHMVIDQIVYDILEDNQKSAFQQLVSVQKYGVMLASILKGIYIMFIQSEHNCLPIANS
jgi:hypothetical protein